MPIQPNPMLYDALRQYGAQQHQRRMQESEQEFQAQQGDENRSMQLMQQVPHAYAQAAQTHALAGELAARLQDQQRRDEMELERARLMSKGELDQAIARGQAEVAKEGQRNAWEREKQSTGYAMDLGKMAAEFEGRKELARIRAENDAAAMKSLLPIISQQVTANARMAQDADAEAAKYDSQTAGFLAQAEKAPTESDRMAAREAAKKSQNNADAARAKATAYRLRANAIEKKLPLGGNVPRRPVAPYDMPVEEDGNQQPVGQRSYFLDGE